MEQYDRAATLDKPGFDIEAFVPVGLHDWSVRIEEEWATLTVAWAGPSATRFGGYSIAADNITGYEGVQFIHDEHHHPSELHERMNQLVTPEGATTEAMVAIVAANGAEITTRFEDDLLALLARMGRSST